MTNHYLLKNNWPSDRNYCLTRVTLKNYAFHWKVLISRNVFKEGSLTNVVKFYSSWRYRRSYWLYFWNWPCKMKGRLGLVASSQVRLSAYGCRRDAWNRRDVCHAGKQLTCTFSLKEQLVGQSTS